MSQNRPYKTGFKSYSSEPSVPPMRQLTEDQKNEINEAFSIFDSNKTGYLDFHELKVALRALGFECTPDELKSIFLKYDKNNNQAISRKDFEEIASYKVATRDPIEEMKKAFELFDIDKTGFISLENLKDVADDLREDVTIEELQAMINEFDLDGDGKISQDEFIQIMKEASSIL